MILLPHAEIVQKPQIKHEVRNIYHNLTTTTNRLPFQQSDYGRCCHRHNNLYCFVAIQRS